MFLASNTPDVGVPVWPPFIFWYDIHILNCIRTKSNYFKLYKQGIIDKTTNDAYKKTLFKTIRYAKRKYFLEYFNLHTNNIKKS